ncbi:hypothetical protein GALMADRAFT_139689 [Galerina marginata CBS 339.88]|uniref:DUF6533 domain-containing protein n=1 Tax=Galerina marginata (strain CBS 339.88) TaxID=685588 RepID=A0A067T0U6_GALM3|nr:hypothetical protein GALMADRAFT_139689 [Galerina marginata CBS 339.88]
MSTVSSNLSSLALEAFAGVEIDLLARAPPLIPFAPTPIHISAINQILLKHGTVIASLVVFIYDYLCTLDQEVAYIWSRPRSFATYLFVLNRYLPFVDLSLSFSGKYSFPFCVLGPRLVRPSDRGHLLKPAIQTFLTPQECLHRYSLITWLNVFGLTDKLPHLIVILTLRTIAIWQRNRWIVAILVVVFFASPICRRSP